MRPDSISFVCRSCSATLNVKSSSAGRLLKCLRCKGEVNVPFPGKKWLRTKCCECGTEHDLEHNDVCETCRAPASEQSTWCTVHRNLLSSKVCADCLIQYHEVTFGQRNTSADQSSSSFPPSINQNRPTPPPVKPISASPPVAAAITESASTASSPVQKSQWTLWCGFVAAHFCFLLPLHCFGSRTHYD